VACAAEREAAGANAGSMLERGATTSKLLIEHGIVNSDDRRSSALDIPHALKLSPPSEAENDVRVLCTTTELAEVYDILSESQQWKERAASTRILLSEGPWEAANITLAWEAYFQTEGYSPHARCENPRCMPRRPRVVPRVPHSSRTPPRLHSAAESQSTPDTALTQESPPELSAATDKVSPEVARSAPPRHPCGKVAISRPLDKVQEERRELHSFCAQCWKFTCFRGSSRVRGLFNYSI